EHERALEDAHEQRRIADVVGGDVLAELADALLQVVFFDHDAADAGIVHAQTWFGISMARPSARGTGACAMSRGHDRRYGNRRPRAASRPAPRRRALRKPRG